MLSLPWPLSQRTSRKGFTLVEMLVALAILSIILLVLGSITAQVQTLWTQTNSKIEQFRGARLGFDTMTQRLAQATLNTYIGYSDNTANDTFYNTANFAPTQFVRQSELRFLSGTPTSTGAFVGTMTSAPNATRPTQSVFFLAPLGYTSLVSGSYPDGNSSALTQMLNACGYYIEFSEDANLPSFFTSMTGYQPRYRYRLMEMLEPSEDNTIYKYTTVTPAPAQSTNQWVGDAFTLTPPPVHILADNIIALIILPQLSADQKDSGGNPFPPTALAPDYYYDSFLQGAASQGGADAGALDSHNQLPPLIQVTMVAIDEPSALRIQAQQANPSTAPDFGLGNLFQDATKYQADLDQLQANLQQNVYADGNSTYTPNASLTLPKKINYRVFTTMVSIKAAQWSTLQTQ